MSTLESTIPAVHLSDVGFVFERGEERVLDIRSREVARSERVFLQGESGSGKSTLLSLLSGMFVPSGRFSARYRGFISVHERKGQVQSRKYWIRLSAV